MADKTLESLVAEVNVPFVGPAVPSDFVNAERRRRIVGHGSGRRCLQPSGTFQRRATTHGER